MGEFVWIITKTVVKEAPNEHIIEKRELSIEGPVKAEVERLFKEIWDIA